MGLADAAALTLCLLVMLAGLAGTLLPVLPGLPLMWLAGLGYGWYTGWRDYGFAGLMITALAVALSLAVDQLASIIGARKFGASRAGVIGSVAGGLAGLIFFSFPGLILGLFAGAGAAEMLFSQRGLKAALASGAGALLGFLAGSLFKFMLGLGLLGAFLWALIF